MSIEKTEVLVVGGGQAGVAMSEHLGASGVAHIVVERHRIAERWRTGRWDSLVANGPAWHDRFPGMEFADCDPDAFAPKETVADYFKDAGRRPTARVTIVEQHVRVIGDAAVSAGAYTFSDVVDGKDVSRPSRYSFVYRYRDGKLMIVHHHSSRMPAP